MLQNILVSYYESPEESSCPQFKQHNCFWLW